MAPVESAAARMRRQGLCNGFGAVRLGLACAIVAFHSVTLTHGSGNAMPPMVQAAARLILPAFFALSGFLVAGSLARAASLREFLLLRLLRLMPALSLVVSITALLLGPLLTHMALRDYFRDPLLPLYFHNVWGQPQFYLPGLFAANPRPGIVNGVLWTIPLEVACYIALAGLSLLPALRRPVLVMVTLVLLIPGLGLANQDFFASFTLGVLMFTVRAWLPLQPLLGFLSIAAALLLEFWFPALPLVALPLAYAVIWLGCRRVPVWLTRGDYSYGLYLCAYPLQQTLLVAMPGQGWGVNLAMGCLLGLGCAMLLWHGVERPVLDRKHELVARLDGRLARA
jgi:peptidoglycan/LPS O-acetylase OafA/YrhL